MDVAPRKQKLYTMKVASTAQLFTEMLAKTDHWQVTCLVNSSDTLIDSSLGLVEVEFTVVSDPHRRTKEGERWLSFPPNSLSFWG